MLPFPFQFGGLGETIYLATERNDPYFSSVALLISGDGAPGSTTIVDSSPIGNALTINGNTQVAVASRMINQRAIYLDGTGDYITAPNNPAFNVGAGDWTLEVAVEVPVLPSTAKRIYSYSKAVITGPLDESIILSINPTNQLTAAIADTSAQYVVMAHPPTIAVNTRYALAFQRAGAELSFWVNGVKTASAPIASAVAWSTDHILQIGRFGADTTRDPNILVEELRFTAGIARYTNTYAPDTIPF